MLHNALRITLAVVLLDWITRLRDSPKIPHLIAQSRDSAGGERRKRRRRFEKGQARTFALDPSPASLPDAGFDLP
jgi:hypothetical protein